MSLDVRIQLSVVANLSRRPAAEQVGPFVAGFDPGTDSPGINYATPRPGALITAGDVTALIGAFREAGRRPRLEYVVSTAPGLEKLLLEQGFTVEEEHDYLICTPGALTTPSTPAGFELREPDDYVAMAAAQVESFGDDPSAVTAEDGARLRRVHTNGGVTLVATAGGVVAGAGQAVAPHDGVSEVAGIAVREPFRRRGLAGALTAAITARLFAGAGDLAWLEASGPGAGRVYERIGYRPAGRRLYMSHPEQARMS
ncbi:GNAT family N-acetyltransferase [Symbioplanes lichenis]|uniref:GNAT family N-acetyltransferase n=1 Tax=Symbioplanes lichenis TaxID=1629072 RepID=UPI00273912D9|nr:GNAT family N-acetyltransferase [Actinoplanes lichenis]